MISEDEAMELAWSLHPELRQVDFERAEWETGVNWHLHLTLDAIVLRRMPAATRSTRSRRFSLKPSGTPVPDQEKPEEIPRGLNGIQRVAH